MIGILKGIFSKRDESEECEDELWIMIKENGFFRDDAHLKIIDELAEIIEESELGELDGHSSGAHQFEINFLEVTNFDRCKTVVDSYFKSKYPEFIYTISKEYETTYEKL